MLLDREMYYITPCLANKYRLEYSGKKLFTEDTVTGKNILFITSDQHHYNFVKNAVIVFTTDHEPFGGQHGLIAKAIHHYEDLLRIPCIVAVPDGKNKGTPSQAIQWLGMYDNKIN